MTRRISLIAVAGVAALVLSASAAFAQAPPERRGLSDFELSAATPITVREAMIEDGFDRAVKAQLVQAMAEDGFDRAVRAKQALQPNVSSYRDSFERAAPPAGTAYVATVSSGGGIEWPQVGIGLGVGILLALGLVLGLRYTRIRPLAH
jgi:hypothetical protein